VASLVLTAVHVSWGVYWMVAVMEGTVLSLVICSRKKRWGRFQTHANKLYTLAS